MQKNTREDKIPNEIPTQEQPHKNPPQPLKDPASPGKSNPINPRPDEPTRIHFV